MQINDYDSEENLDQYVEQYVKFGVNILNQKTKLVKRVYLLISIFYIFLLGFMILEETNQDFRDTLIQPIQKNWQVFLIIFVVLLFVVGFMPERNNWTILFVFPLWILFIFYFTLCISGLTSIWPECVLLFCVLAVHHLIITIYILLTQNFDYKVIFLNVIVSCIGMIFLWLQNFVTFSQKNLIYLIFLQYFGVNLSYYLLIELFSKVIQKKFWRRRKGFTTVLIFIAANFFIFFLLIVIVYYIYLLIQDSVQKRSTNFRRSDIDVQITTRNTINDFKLSKSNNQFSANIKPYIQQKNQLRTN